MKKKELVSNSGMQLKIALIQRGLRYTDAGQLVNELLPPELWMSETIISKIVTGRQRVKPQQAAAFAEVLNIQEAMLFPTLKPEVES